MSDSIHTIMPGNGGGGPEDGQRGQEARRAVLRHLSKKQLRDALVAHHGFYCEDDSKELLVCTLARLPLQISVVLRSVD